jgi:hypothetical protein
VGEGEGHLQMSFSNVVLFLFLTSPFSFPCGFEEKRFYGGINLHFFASDKVFDNKRKLKEIGLEYIERRLEFQFGFNIAYGLRMEFLVPLIGREIDYGIVANVYFIGNQLEIEPSISDINAWGIGDIKAKIGGSYRIMKNLEGGAFLDFKLPTGSTTIGNGKIPTGTGQADAGFYIFGRVSYGLLFGELNLGYVVRTYGEPSYILYYPLSGTIGKGIDPGDEIEVKLKLAFKVRGSFWGGIDLNLLMTQGDGVKLFFFEDDKLKEEWGYYGSSNYGSLKPFLSIRTEDGFIGEIGFTLPFYGKNYPSEPAFPFLRNFPLFPSTGVSASVGYNF